MALPLTLNAYQATISNGTSLSGAVAMGADTLVGIWMPGAWDAAGLTFQVSPDGGTTWLELQDGAGAAIGATVSAGVFISIDSSKWRGVNMVKVRSGTSGAAVNQTADRVVTLIGRPEMW